MEGLDWGFLNSINVLTVFLDSVFAYLALTNQSQDQTNGQSFFYSSNAIRFLQVCKNYITNSPTYPQSTPLTLTKAIFPLPNHPGPGTRQLEITSYNPKAANIIQTCQS